MKNAVITGASNGIGRAIAIKFADLGMDLVINYFRDEDAAQSVTDEAEKRGVEAYAVKADVGTAQGRKKIIEEAVKRFGHIDVLVNNAGVFIENDLFTASEDDFDRTMSVIVKGTFFLTQSVVKNMVDNDVKGRIINISSAATQAFADIPIDYCTAKAGVNMMTKSVAKEVGKYGITCNAIMPGAIPTKINKWQFDDPEIRERLKNGSVLKQFGDAGYIAKAAEYFVSDEAKWTTGAILAVDGGFSL